MASYGNKEVKLGTDEITLVLLPTHLPSTIHQWPDKAEPMVEIFLERACLGTLFGPVEMTDEKLVNGYTSGLTYTDRPWQLVICWNDLEPRMGVCIRFSAQAWAAYRAAFRAKYGSLLLLHNFLQMIDDDSYISRLSRVDLTADYMDWGLRVDTIYRRFDGKRYKAVTYRNRPSAKRYDGIEANGICTGFYIGSHKAKSKAFLRVYDKKREQLEKGGTRLNDALACKDWTRFEAVFRGKYAHQLTEKFKSVSSANEESQLIAQMISDRYCFVDVKKDDVTDFTEILLDVVNGSVVAPLVSPSPRDNSLEQSISYLVQDSGLPTIAYKIGELFGANGLALFWKYLETEAWWYGPKRAADNHELQRWLKQHRKEYEGRDIGQLLIPVFQPEPKSDYEKYLDGLSSMELERERNIVSCQRAKQRAKQRPRRFNPAQPDRKQ